MAETDDVRLLTDLPADLAKGPSRCWEESPAWGWEGEGEQCMRRAGHGSDWHYYNGSFETALFNKDVILWWKGRS